MQKNTFFNAQYIFFFTCISILADITKPQNNRTGTGLHVWTWNGISTFPAVLWPASIGVHKRVSEQQTVCFESNTRQSAELAFDLCTSVSADS